MVGATNSIDFPTTGVPYQPFLGGGYDAFVVRVSEGSDPGGGGNGDEPTGDVGTIKGTVTVDGKKKGGVVVTADTGVFDDTNGGGKYSIGNVSVGVISVTAEFGSCSEPRPVTLNAGETIIEDFALSNCDP